MKAAHRHALSSAGLVAAFAASGALAALGAQGTIRRTPPADVIRMMVPALRSSDKAMGCSAADAIRSRLNQDIPYKSLWVIQKNDIAATLEASGFDPCSPLAPNDAKELSKLLRADEYLDGSVTRVPAGYQFAAKLVLSTDNALVQPIPAVTGARMDLAAANFSRELQVVRKQLDADRKCTQALRDQKYDDAVRFAREGIATYDKATLSRLCLANAYVLQKQPADSIIGVTTQILAIDSTSRLALGWAADAYMARGDTNAAIANWTKLVSLDPTNTKLVDAVVRQIASTGRISTARPIIEQAVAANPGDPSLLRLQWLVLLAAKDYKAAETVGEQMVTADTSLATVDYYTRLANVYAADSQPAKASATLARALQKFPGQTDLVLLKATNERTNGQLPVAIATMRTLPANTPRANLVIAQIFNDMNQPDSAVAALHVARTVDSASVVGPTALVIGNQLFKAASGTKNRDDMLRARSVIAFADSVAPTAQSKFLGGVANFMIGQSAATEAGKTKSCPLAKMAQDALVNAQLLLPQGASLSPEAKQAAGTYMGYAQQFSPVVDNQVKTFCMCRASRPAARPPSPDGGRSPFSGTAQPRERASVSPSSPGRWPTCMSRSCGRAR